MVELSFAERLLLPVMRYATIPRHIGFIMDGNRRYAQQQNLVSVKGHDMGSEKLLQVLNWCLLLGVQEVTVYAFSIDNFNRSKEEVDYLMNLAADKFNKMADDEDDFLSKNRIQVAFWGNMELLPERVVSACQRLTERTSFDSPLLRFNILFAYSSKFDLERAKALHLSSTGLPGSGLEDFRKFLFSRDSLPLDLVVRTSGETRLSDFLIWNIRGTTLIAFLNVLWPDLSIFSLARAILEFNRFRIKI